MTLDSMGIHWSEAAILWDVIAEHLDEASFLWSQWEGALVSPLYTLHEAAERVEGRMLAHIDGLVIGGEPVAARTLIPTLQTGQQGEVFAAAYALLAAEEERVSEEVFSTYQAAPAQQQAMMRRALCLVSPRGSQPLLRNWLRADEGLLRATALLALCAAQADIRHELVAALRDPTAEVVIAGLAAAARVAPTAYEHLIRPHLYSADGHVRAAALIPSALAGLDDAWRVCRDLLLRPGPLPDDALLLLSLSESPRDLQLLIDCVATPERQRAALWALGFSGSHAGAEACLHCAKEPLLAALAGEAFSAITGVDLEKEGLLAPKSDGAEAQPDAAKLADLDADLSLKPEDDLPIPDAAALSTWWQRHSREFAPRVRYLYGKPVDSGTLLGSMPSVSMRRVHGLAVMLAMNSQQRTLLETHGLAGQLMIKLASL